MSQISSIDRDESLCQLIIEASPAGLLIVDSKAKIRLVNPAAESMFGYRAEELIGTTIESLLPSSYRKGHRQARKRYAEHPRPRSMVDGRDLWALRKDGSVFPVDISLHPIEIGGETWVLANVLDVTERRRAEDERRKAEEFDQLAELQRIREELQLSENRMRFLVENLPAGAVYVDQQELFFNAAVEELTGYRSEEIRTVNDWFQVLCTKASQENLHKYELVKAGGFREECLLSIRRKDGFERELRIGGHRYDHHEVWLVTDITELHDAQLKLVQAERLAAIGQMVTGLAHESRNALQRARGCLDLLELDLDGYPEQLDLITRIRRSLSDLQHNYEEVRQYAAPINLRLSEIRLTDLVGSAFDNLLCEYPIAKHRLCIEQSDVSEIQCDSHRMTQVFRNIIENAMAAASSGVTIGVHVNDIVLLNRSVRRIEISDNGPGMPENVVGRSFEPFFTTKQSGTGLGLPICQRIVDAHGGTISIRSNVDQGTTVTVILPLESPAEQDR